MPTVTITSSLQEAGTVMSGRITETGKHILRSAPSIDNSIAAALAGTLTTRTDDNTGVATLATGHGIASSDVVDVYWAAGRRYGMTATVATNDVTVDGGAGDNLPAQDTAVTVCKVVEGNVDFDGDEMSLLAARSETDGLIVFLDSSDNVLLALDLTAKQMYAWGSTMPVTRPITGNAVDRIRFSHSATSASTMVVLVLYGLP
jgi:hypothetical protein